MVNETMFSVSSSYSLVLSLREILSAGASLIAPCLCVKSLSCVWLFEIPWTIVRQAPLSMGFSRQEYWSGLPFSSPGNLRDPGIKPVSPVLAGGFFTTEPHGKASFYQWFTPKGGSMKQLWWGSTRIQRGIRYPWNSNLIIVENTTHLLTQYTQIWNCFFENVSVWGDNSLIWRL